MRTTCSREIFLTQLAPRGWGAERLGGGDWAFLSIFRRCSVRYAFAFQSERGLASQVAVLSSRPILIYHVLGILAAHAVGECRVTRPGNVTHFKGHHQVPSLSRHPPQTRPPIHIAYGAGGDMWLEFHWQGIGC